MRILGNISIFLALLLPLGYADAIEPEAPGDRGLYAIWYSRQAAEVYLGQPYIRGGQIIRQWAQVEKKRGVYDFSAIDQQLRYFNKRKQKATLQINGNQKPDWLFEQVPYVKEKLSPQVQDAKGTLMYWYPVHRDAYLDLIKALAAHLREHPDRNGLLGIRMNLNALGTEHSGVPQEYVSPSGWVVPDGISRESLIPWSQSIQDEYVKDLVDSYITNFEGNLPVFVRTGIENALLQEYRSQFEKGTLSWFHTSSEAEPRARFAEKKYQRFVEYCRSGKTTCYAEPWASAWGHHGPKTDDRWCSPPQWNYWRLLFDLQCGASYIALYANDVRVGITGEYGSGKKTIYRDGKEGRYRDEFNEAFQFAAKYAGYQPYPEQSPGAWIAFRENHVVRAENGIPVKRRKLKVFTSDYTFLMKRLPGDKSQGLNVVNIGPDDQRFGAWARLLPAGEIIRLALDDRFAGSLAGHDVRVNVIYLDDKAGTFEVVLNGRSRPHRRRGSGRWQIACFDVGSDGLHKDNTGAHITLGAIKAPIYLHMVEVQRR